IQVGTVGVGLFVYMIANAYHWMLELKLQNFMAILLNPFIALLIGGFLFMKFGAPRAIQNRDRVSSLIVLLSIFHSLITIIVWLAAMMVSPAFASLFGAPHLYQGQLIGSTVPSIVIILFTKLFYGGLVGSILTQFRPKAVYQPQKTTETSAV